ncbi:MAG: AAA family ATPase [Patescibacteria group bacterium]|jgi:predicted kinase
MKSLQILRGIQGAGKSTYAKAVPDALICSADDFFLQPDGTYAYDRSKIQEAHAFCFNKCHEALHQGDSPVIIDNMNAEAWEISPYVMLGQALGYTVEILNFHCEVSVGAMRNVHSVPFEDIDRVAKRMKEAKLPRFWKIRQMAC